MKRGKVKHKNNSSFKIDRDVSGFDKYFAVFAEKIINFLEIRLLPLY